MFLENLRGKVRRWQIRYVHSIDLNASTKASQQKTPCHDDRGSSVLKYIPVLSDACQRNVQLVAVRKIILQESFTPLPSPSECISLTNSLNQEGVCMQFKDGKDSVYKGSHSANLPNDSEKNSSGKSADEIQFEEALLAINRGDENYLCEWLKESAVQRKSINPKCISLLCIAVGNDQLRCAKTLLKHDSDLLPETIKSRNILHIAAGNGAYKCLKYLLKTLCKDAKKSMKQNSHCTNKIAYNYLVEADDNGDTPLHMACRKFTCCCFKAVYRAIIKHLGWDAAKEALLHRNFKGQNPLHVACLWRNFKVVSLLLTDEFEKAFTRTSHVSFNIHSLRQLAKDLQNVLTATLMDFLNTGTILHGMAGGHCNCCKSETAKKPISKSDFFLLPHSFTYMDDDIDVPEEKCASCEQSVRKIIELINQKIPSLISMQRKGGVSPLMVAVMNDAVSVVKTLLMLGVNLEEEDWEGRTALHYAANYGASRQVAILLFHGASPLRQDRQGVTPVHLAALRGFSACLRMLYTASGLIDLPTETGYTAFLWSAYYGMDASLKAMLQTNSSLDKLQVNSEKATALHLAAAQGHNKCVEVLFNRGWDIEARNVREETPLLLAARFGRVETVRRLIELGADVRAIDKEGNTCLHLSAKSDLPKEVFSEFLLLIPALEMLNIQDVKGKTPLHYAVGADSFSSVYELLKLGSNIRLKDNDGWDPFMYAIRCGSSHIIALLIKHCPNVNCYSVTSGYSTLSLALEYGDAILVAQLKGRGAKMPREILNDSARKIQRWYRKRVVIRKLLSCSRRTSEKVKQACAHFGSNMIDAGFEMKFLI